MEPRSGVLSWRGASGWAPLDVERGGAVLFLQEGHITSLCKDGGSRGRTGTIGNSCKIGLVIAWMWGGRERKEPQVTAAFSLVSVWTRRGPLESRRRKRMIDLELEKTQVPFSLSGSISLAGFFFLFQVLGASQKRGPVASQVVRSSLFDQC